jgi:nucleotide-binding universal stress UspA family protein
METRETYRILVATDFSDLAGQAFAEAISLARRNPYAELHVVAVVDKEASEIVPQADRRASLVQITDHLRERLIAETARMLGPDPSRRVPSIVHIRVGKIAEQIAGLAGEIGADLVVVGTHGRRGVKHLLLGSVAERTVRFSPCAVLVVRPKDTHVLDNLPTIEPPCPTCLKTREETQGEKWWCEAHSSERGEFHAFSYSARLDYPPVPAPYN